MSAVEPVVFRTLLAGGWPLLVRPVIEMVSPWYSIPFLLYVVFAAGHSKNSKLS